MDSALVGINQVGVVFKVYANVGVLFGLGHQGHVDSAPRNRPNCLAVLAVGLGAEASVFSVHDAAVHGNRFAAHGFCHANGLQGPPSAVAEGKIDGAPALVACAAGIPPAFKDIHAVASLR